MSPAFHASNKARTTSTLSWDIARPVSRRVRYRVTAATIYAEVNGIGSGRYRFSSMAGTRRGRCGVTALREKRQYGRRAAET